MFCRLLLQKSFVQNRDNDLFVTHSVVNSKLWSDSQPNWCDDNHPS